MLLVIDVGNTNIVLGVYEKNNLIKNWRLSTMHNRTSDEIGMMIVDLLKFDSINPKSIDAVIISSVVPPVMFPLQNAIKKYINKDPLIVDSTINTGITIKYENPQEVGADRIVNAAAAYHEYKCNLIIIDFGTATTFCAISENAEYLGGVICPGIKISLDALFKSAAKLPKIELAKPDKVIGKTTITSMQSGLVYGYAGQIEYIVHNIKEEMGGKNIKVIATGGMATLIADATGVIDLIDQDLTLKGLKLIYDINN